MRYAIVLVGAASLVLYAALALPSGWFAGGCAPARVYLFEGILAALLVLLAVLLVVLKYDATGPHDSLRDLHIIFAFAVAFRLVLLPQTPWLSNDIYRYLWDADLMHNGVNPYLHPPQAPELEAFRDNENYSRLSHKYVATVYPPVLQLFFALGRGLGEYSGLGGVFGIKLVFVIFDLLLIACLVKVLPYFQLDPRWVVLYAWHPLPIVEIAGSGHSDGVGVLFLVLALAALCLNRFRFAAAFLALAFLVKLVSVLLLPFLFLPKERRKHAWQALAVFCAMVMGSYLPFLAAGKNLISGLLTYSAKWRFNDGLFTLLFTPVHALLPDRLVMLLMVPAEWEITPEVLITRRVDLALLLTKAALALLFLWLCAWLWQRAKVCIQSDRALPWMKLALILLAGFFLFSPTLQPWYLLWLLPLLCLTVPAGISKIEKQSHEAGRSTPVPAEAEILPRARALRLWMFLAALSGTVFLSYWILIDYVRAGVWQEQNWVKWVEFGVPALIFFLPQKFLRRSS